MGLQIYNCKQCGHKWANRGGNKPKICPNPKCHSLRWDEYKRKK